MAVNLAHAQNIHFTRVLHGVPLLWLSTAFLAGLLLAAWQSLPWPVWAAAGLLSCILGWWERRFSGSFWTAWRQVSALPLGVVAAALLLGAARYQAALPQVTAGSLAFYTADGSATAQGLVVTPPQSGSDWVSLRLQLQSLTLLDARGHPLSSVTSPQGLLLARVPASSDWRYGDRVQVTGQLAGLDRSQPAMREALYRQDVQAQMPYAAARLLAHDQGSLWLSAADHLRRSCKQVIYRIFPQPEAALLSGILIGDDNDLPLDVQTAFQNTGTAHIIAISGFNMAIVAGLLTLFAGRLLPRPWGLPLVFGGIVFYTLLTGATPSVVRAALMSVMGLLGGLLGRRQMGLNSLAFTAAAMSLFDPFLPWNISFQLSFGATLGLVLYAEPLEGWVFSLAERALPAGWARQASGWMGEFLLCTLAAQITTLPVMLYHFQRLSLSALLANILVLPPQSAVMVLGGLALLVGLVLPPIGQWAAYPAWVLLAYTTHMVTLLAGIPSSVLFVESIPLWLVGLAYALMIFLTPGFARFFAPLKGLLKPGVTLLGAWLLAALVLRMGLSLPDGRLHITFLGGGQQATLLIRTPAGETLLINGATQAGNLSSELGKRLPPLERSLGGWLLTDSSNASLQEFNLVDQRFTPGLVYRAPSLPDSGDWRSLSSQLALQGVSVAQLQTGQHFDLGQGAALDVLAATNRGTALLINWKNSRFLVPGGLDGRELLRLAQLQDWSGCTVLLAPVDLADANGTVNWNNSRPLAVLVTGSPQAAPAGWIDTARLGWIELQTDGLRLWLESQR